MSLTTSAPAPSARRATSGENVSADTAGTASFPSFWFLWELKGWKRCRSLVVSPSTAGTSAAASSSADTGGPALAATAPTSSIPKPASASARPSRTACSGVPLRAPSNIESTVTLTIPAPIGRERSSSRPQSLQLLTRRAYARRECQPVACRLALWGAVYADRRDRQRRHPAALAEARIRLAVGEVAAEEEAGRGRPADEAANQDLSLRPQRHVVGGFEGRAAGGAGAERRSDDAAAAEAGCGVPP